MQTVDILLSENAKLRLRAEIFDIATAGMLDATAVSLQMLGRLLTRFAADPDATADILECVSVWTATVDVIHARCTEQLKPTMATH